MSKRVKVICVACAIAAGCAEGVAPDPDGGYARELRAGGLHRDAVQGVAAGASSSSGSVDVARMLATAAPLADARGIEVGPPAVTDEGGLITAFAPQVVNGVAIRGAYIYMVARTRGADDAELVASSYHVYQGAAATVIPTIDDAEAMAAARVALRAGGGAAHVELALVPDGAALALVWDVTIDGIERGARVMARGDDAGRVEVVDDRAWSGSGSLLVSSAAGTATAWIAAGGAPGGRGVPRSVPAGDLLVRSASAMAYTDGNGAFAIDAASGAAITATVSGRAATVVAAGGAPITASAPASATTGLILASSGAGEAALAQTTAYHFLTRARRYLLANGFTAERLGAPLTARVGVPDRCNAYYTPAARAVVYFAAGGGCRDTAEASIVIHEYGHFIDDVYGGIVDHGLSEGWGDALACLVLDDPVIGGDLFDDGGALRSCANQSRYPRGGGGEPHATGEAWAGFVWDVRQGLIAALGRDAGDAATRALVLPSLRSNTPDIPAAVREVFLRDDDNGDLGDHTPHWDVLAAAARRHGLEFATETDHAAPGRIADLTVRAIAPTRIRVAWTAPGDDGARGTAGRYELRWSSRPITLAGFAAAIPAVAPDPSPAGGHDEAEVAVPPIGRIYVAVRAVDEQGNQGPLASVAAVELPAPHTVFGDGGEHGLGTWVATGLWHVTSRRHGGGSHAFWYGREASGDYDTGAANRGTLTSPAIDLRGVSDPQLTWTEYIDVERDPTWDRLRVEVIDDRDGAVIVAVDKPAAPPRRFAPRLLDLAAATGRTVRLRFSFDTGDATLDDLEGWYVDDVAVIGAGGSSPPPPPPSGDVRLVINEILADPPAGFDTDGDGAWSARGDEMIELVNAGHDAIDLGGASIADADAVRAVLPAGTTLAAGKALVITGSAAPAIPGVTAIGSSGLLLNNDGDTVTVRARGGALLATAAYGAEGGRDQSLTRRIDGDPTSPLVGHREVSSLPASPGRRAGGQPF